MDHSCPGGENQTSAEPVLAQSINFKTAGGPPAPLCGSSDTLFCGDGEDPSPICWGGGGGGLAMEGHGNVEDPSAPESAEEGRTRAWLSLGKKAAEGKCRELEKELAAAREAATSHAASLHVAEQKIRHLEAENQGLVAGVEFREKQVAELKEAARTADERAQAHERGLAEALEQLSKSGQAQARQLEEIAQLREGKARTRAALAQAEKLVFDQRQEADRRRMDEVRSKGEAATLREKLTEAERRNTEILTKQATSKLGQGMMRSHFGRSSTFCSALLSCFRRRPQHYRPVTSKGSGLVVGGMGPGGGMGTG
ncbi:unnamed protein product, partial [Discosporangium mesarthrocarpum]